MPETSEMKVDATYVLQHTRTFLQEIAGKPLTKDSAEYIEMCLMLYGQGCRQEGRAQKDA